jgi:hypothetical protein
MTSRSDIASTGVASTMTMLTVYIAHTNSGRRNQVMPGARNMCAVAMKFTPVAIEENPTTKTPAAAAMT